ncbi:MAG TPA: glutamine amidotransferase [Polyangiaceae bacterium]|nr:glutamine amidotransferase [Polyangiaceae bacterium]
MTVPDKSARSPHRGCRRPFAILVAGQPIEKVRARRGEYADMIRASAGESGVTWMEVDLRQDTPLPEPTTLGGAVVTGSSASVTERASWMLRAEEYLRALIRDGVPTLGICFGHQLLGQALGGHVTRNPRGREIGTVAFEVLEADPLLSSAIAPWHANATHIDTIARLPSGSRVLAQTALELHAVVRFADAAWGVQFHPEMDGSTIRDYLEARRAILLSEGLDPDGLLRHVTDGEAGASTLVRFVALALHSAPTAEPRWR